MTGRTLVVGCLASLASTLILGSPLAAQTSRDLLLPQARTAVRAERLDLVDSPGMLPVRVRRAESVATAGLVGVAQPATETYSYDDDSFENAVLLVDDLTDEVLYEMEFAQRFTLSGPGTIQWAETCIVRSEDDTEPDVNFWFTLYGDAGGVPGGQLERYTVAARIPQPDRFTCFRLADELVGQEVPVGHVWATVSWLRGTPPENTKLLAIDRDNSAGRRAFRARPEEGDAWEVWQQDPDSGVYGIRLAVNHQEPEPEPDPEPDPTPEPDPDPTPDPDDGPPGRDYTDCVPETSPLVFDGYSVRMCYETGGGTVGEAKAGIWASGESGLLWFFNRDNAEVLVKVLNGCHINNHRWVYVAPVTDLAFNLYVVDSQGNTWSHHNRLGDTASTRSDNEAFRCSNQAAAMPLGSAPGAGDGQAPVR